MPFAILPAEEDNQTAGERMSKALSGFRGGNTAGAPCGSGFQGRADPPASPGGAGSQSRGKSGGRRVRS